MFIVVATDGTQVFVLSIHELYHSVICIKL